MNLEVTLLGRLRLNSDGDGHLTLQVPASATLAEVARQAGLEEGNYMYVINDQYVNDDRASGYRLQEGDRITISPPIKGG